MSRYLEKSDENPDYWGDEDENGDENGNQRRDNNYEDNDDDDDDDGSHDLLGDDEEVTPDDAVEMQKSLDDFRKEQQLKRADLMAKNLGSLAPRVAIDSSSSDEQLSAGHSQLSQQQQQQQKKTVVRSPLLSDASMRFEPATIGNKSSSRFLRIDAAATTIVSSVEDENRLLVFGGEDADGTHFGDGFYLSKSASSANADGVHFAVFPMKLSGAQVCFPPSTSAHSITFVSQSNALMCIGGVLRDNTRLNNVSYLANARSLSSSAFGIVHPENPDVKEARGSTVTKGRKSKISYETFEFCSWYV